MSEVRESTHNARIGKQGEDLAAQYLIDRGYRVVARNWRYGREGEVDIVAVGPGREATLVIVEVKTRTGVLFGEPVEAVSFRKAMRLRRLAQAWCLEKSPAVRRIRIDAIGVLLPPGQPPQVTHVQDVT